MKPLLFKNGHTTGMQAQLPDWLLRARDGLEELQEAAVKKREALGTGRTKHDARRPRSRGVDPVEEPDEQDRAPDGTVPGGASLRTPLETTLELLGRCRLGELQRLQKLRGIARVLGVYRYDGDQWGPRFSPVQTLGSKVYIGDVIMA